MFRDSFMTVCKEEFPQHMSALEALLPGAEMNFNAGQIRLMAKLFARFFEDTKAPWPRYDAYRSASHSNGDDEEDDIDYGEMGELLAQRICSKHDSDARSMRLLENVDDRPYWKFVAVMDGRTPEKCRQLHGTTRHHTDPFWSQHSFPCEELECRCRMTAVLAPE